MTSPKFIHLHVHTEYSLIDGLPRIKQLLASVKKYGMPAVAITDHCNLFGMVKFYKTAVSMGVKPIIGVEVLLHNESGQPPYVLILLCKNVKGYKNLTHLISRSYLEQTYGSGVLHPSWLQNFSEGLIALSGAARGDIGRALLQKDEQVAQDRLLQWMALFPDSFYIELQRTGRELEEEYNRLAISLAQEFHVPIVATNDVRFLIPEDFEAHEARVCIHDGRVLEDPKRPRIYSVAQYLRTTEEMVEIFKDTPEAITNTWMIAKKCNLQLELGKVCLPNFPVPNALSLDAYLITRTNDGLKERLNFLFPDPEKQNAVLKSYQERLEMELSVIQKMGFQGYFLIVADFIAWAKQNRIPVGPGRGSGPGSLVAYALGITELDPIACDLLFERFLNPERASMPDFDIDFCMEGRDRVIDYVAGKYGKESVSQIITYGSMAARAVVRDVGRVLGHPYGFVDKLAKLIPFEIGMTLNKALQDESLQARYLEDEEVKTLVDLALKLEGLPRNPGKHAGGVVIAPSVLTDFTPLYCEPGGEHSVTQFDKEDVEAVGLVKFDFLGLRTLTIIDWAIETINSQREKDQHIDISRIPMNDPLVFDLLCSGQTTAVFQLESRGMKDLIKRLQPHSFEDIIPLVALFRPGPLQSGMVDDFIDRRHGRAKVEYPHPELVKVLQPTYGVILYQEQVMQIAQVLAGFTLGRADLLRSAMGKKKPEEMAKQRTVFIEGACARGVSEHTAQHIFDLMEKFAGYGFNKAHSTAYALLSYQTAWLKANFPAEYMAAVLSADMDNTDKVVRLIEDCHKMQLKISPPHINESHYRFTGDNQGGIIYGLGAIKGVGEAALENCIEVRKQTGIFLSLFDFCQRVDTRKVNRRVLESLIRAGAMDCFGVSRACLMISMDKALHQAEQRKADQEIGQNDLFGDLMASSDNSCAEYITTKDWSDETRLLGEKETLGLYLTGHPINKYEKELAGIITAKIADVRPAKEKNITVAGLAISIRSIFTKNGNRMGLITLDDRSARIELVIFSDLFAQCHPLLEKDALLIVEGEVGMDEFTESYRITGRKIMSLEQARRGVKYLQLDLTSSQCETQNVLNQLTTLLSSHPRGTCPITIRYKNLQGITTMALGEEWRVCVNQHLLDQLHQICGSDCVGIFY